MRARPPVRSRCNPASSTKSWRFARRGDIIGLLRRARRVSDRTHRSIKLALYGLTILLLVARVGLIVKNRQERRAYRERMEAYDRFVRDLRASGDLCVSFGADSLIALHWKPRQDY